jgi:hypothetical protein
VTVMASISSPTSSRPATRVTVCDLVAPRSSDEGAIAVVFLQGTLWLRKSFRELAAYGAATSSPDNPPGPPPRMARTSVWVPRGR